MFYRTLKMRKWLHGALVGLLLAYLYTGVFLHRCGDVEVNPGPVHGPSSKADNLRQTRLKSSGGSSAGASPTTPSKTTEDLTLKDVMDTLHSKFDEVKEDIRQVKDICAGLHEELTNLKQEVTDLKRENQTLRDQNERLCEKVEYLERKTDDLEGRSKRNNIIFYGIPRRENETREDCEGLVKDVLTDKLELPRDIDFDRIHRLNGKKDSPIIGRCTFYKDKECILSAKRKLRGSDVFIGEDFSLRVRDVRRKLVPHLKEARRENKKASMVFDHLIIDGKKFGLDHDQKLKLLQ